MKPVQTRALSRPVLHPVLIGLGGIAALTASSWISVPMYPVPVTMQTMVVLLLGAVLGPRAGAATVLAWLALSLTGAPVLAGGKPGLLALTGPTAGYLLAFPLVAFLAGYLPKGDGLAAHGLRLAGFLALHAAILFAGWSWLSALIGPKVAFVSGVVPFLIGSVIKSGLATAILAAFPRRADV
ncbi:MAG TPA: biotin transporter BioY [Hyphomonas sp.]|nr:biotin transporter BioY [Hyphomonas sp.]